MKLEEARDIYGRNEERALTVRELVQIVGSLDEETAQKVTDIIVDPSGYVQDTNFRDFETVKNVGTCTAIKISAAIEMGKRLSYICSKRKLISLNSPEKVYAFWGEKLRRLTQEHFIVNYLNVKNRLLGYRLIGKGNTNAVPVDVKEIMRWAVRYKAYSLILVHNHPSGYPDPSQEDISVTQSIAAAAKLMDCYVIDHVIIGDGTYVSLHDRGIC